MDTGPRNRKETVEGSPIGVPEVGLDFVWETPFLGGSLPELLLILKFVWGNLQESNWLNCFLLFLNSQIIHGYIPSKCNTKEKAKVHLIVDQPCSPPQRSPGGRVWGMHLQALFPFFHRHHIPLFTLNYVVWLTWGLVCFILTVSSCLSLCWTPYSAFDNI